MLKRIVFINVFVVIHKIIFPPIVRRVDIDDINLAFMGIGEGGEGF